MKSLTYGTLPTKAQFMSHWRRLVGDPDEAEMLVHLKGVDTKAADVPGSSYSEPGYYDADEVWDLVKALTKAWRSGGGRYDPYPELAEERGALASSILSVLDFEWV